MTAAITETTPAPTLYRLLATYWSRYDLFTLAMRAADEIDPDAPERDAADDAQQRTSDQLDRAALAVIEYLPTWSVDAAIRASFIQGLAERNGGSLIQQDLDALLSTLPDLVARQKGGEQ